MIRNWLGTLLMLLAALGVVTPAMAEKITFKKTHIDPKFRSEGVAVGDFNNDGKQDIAAGWVWYEAPSWKMHSTVENPPEHDPLQYSRSFQTFAMDVNGDKWTDIIIVEFPGDLTSWLENPKEPGKTWTKHQLTRVTNNESPQLIDVDGDKKLDLLFAWSPDPGNTDGPERQVGYASPESDATKPWKLFPVSEKNAPGAARFGHGIGVGDVNKDGKNDILVAAGWWEAPKDANELPWKFHAVNFDCDGGAAQMFVYDFNGDGKNDVLASSPHRKGIYWFEQQDDGKFAKHEIDAEYSQTHGVCFADINGDGTPDIITGKRWWAHGPNGDPEPNNPAVLYWYEVGKKDGKPTFERHQIDHDSGVGTQFEVADVNGDKLLDIIVSNKKGTFYFEQVRE